MVDAYREPGKRKKIPKKLRNWFIQNADGTEKGPFEYDSLISSCKDDRLKPTTLVRPEDETEWRPLKTLLDKEADKALKKASAAGHVTAGRSYSGDSDYEDPGNFGAGLLAGLCCGILGFLVVTVTAKGSETKRGARWGLIIQFALGILVRLFAAAAH